MAAVGAVVASDSSAVSLERAMRATAERQAEIDAELLRLRQCLSDYNSLQRDLAALPERVDHPILVPHGKMAMFPGKLIHTNEVFVLLGDNYFALRSAQQASQLAGRRAEWVTPQIESKSKEAELLREQAEQLQAMHSITAAQQGTFEIREEYNSDEESDKLWLGAGGSGLRTTKDLRDASSRAHAVQKEALVEQAQSEVVTPQVAAASKPSLFKASRMQASQGDAPRLPSQSSQEGGGSVEVAKREALRRVSFGPETELARGMSSDESSVSLYPTSSARNSVAQAFVTQGLKQFGMSAAATGPEVTPTPASHSQSAYRGNSGFKEIVVEKNPSCAPTELDIVQRELLCSSDCAVVVQVTKQLVQRQTEEFSEQLQTEKSETQPAEKKVSRFKAARMKSSGDANNR
ncbi:MAG: hypothetical protein SGPRY_005114 [Prymnesium sp.]